MGRLKKWNEARRDSRNSLGQESGEILRETKVVSLRMTSDY